MEALVLIAIEVNLVKSESTLAKFVRKVAMSSELISL